MRKKFVRELGWIDEKEMLDLTAIAQSAPGAIAVNASVLIGYRVGGVAGALLTVLGTVLPPLAVISVVSLFYKAFRDNVIVSMAMSGMLCGVAAVICDTVVNMARTLLREKRILPPVILVLAFAAVRIFSVNIALVILVCGAIGAADSLIRNSHRKEAEDDIP